MSIYIKAIGLLAGMFIFLNPSVFAQKGVGNSIGIARGFEQPEIELIEGTLDHIKTGPCEHAAGYAYTGTHLFIKSGDTDQLINVHLRAANAVESFVNGLEIGQEVSIDGFRTDELQPLNFIAREVSANGHTLTLRDENLRPFWAGDQNLPRGQRLGRHGCRW